MHPVHDVDALLLLATALASKRRPAQLAEIMAAADLLQGSIPLDVDMAAAFLRLSTHGLIGEAAGGFTLTPQALELMAGVRYKKKAETPERLLAVRQELAGYTPKGEGVAIRLPTELVSAAILAHRTFLKSPGRNMLVPKPKAAVDRPKPPGQWRRLDGARRSKS
jgi:hypothetical protein